MINIDDKTRRLSQATIVIGYKQENKAESIEFEIPDYLKEYGKKICFKTKDGKVFSKLFDNTISNIFTFTRTETQYGELDATIEFFKTENEDMVIYKTSMLHIIFNESIVCEDEVQPDEPKIPILESLIEKVTELNNTITENEETRNNNENTRISNENKRKTNEKERETYYTNIQNKVNIGEFNGATYLPNVDSEGNISWTNNKGLENPSSQNIRGPQGIQGAQGEPFKIKKTYSSTEEMQANFDNMEVGDYVMIANSVEIEDNAKLYYKAETEWVFITDFSGATGIQGEQGPQGIQGIQGERGIGISKLEVINGSLWVTLTDSTTQNAGLIITDEVKQWIVDQVTDNAKSDFNTYYHGKVTDFDNHTTTKIQEYNTNATNKVNEYNQNAESLINRVVECEAENERLRNDIKSIALQGEASGESIHIEDSSDARCELDIGGNQKQDTRAGYNQIDIDDFFEGTRNGVTITKDLEKGSLTFNGTATSTFAISVPLSISKGTIVSYSPNNSKLNKEVIMRLGTATGTIGGLLCDAVDAKKENFELTEDINGVQIRIGAGITLDTFVIFPQLETNTSLHNFEIYGASPSIDYPSPVKSVGNIKNILDMRNAKGGTSGGITCNMIADGSYTYKGTASSKTINIWLLGSYNNKTPIFRLEPGTYYIDGVILFDENNALANPDIKKIFTFINAHDITGVRALDAVSGNTYDETKYPIIAKIDHEIPWIPYDCGYAKVDIFNKNIFKETTNNYDTSNILVTKYDASNVDTKYIEHQEQSYLIDVQQPMLEGDYLDLENEKEHHEWGKVVLDGTETWLEVSYGFVIGVTTVDSIFRNRDKTKFDGYSNYLKVEKTSQAWTKINYCGWNTDGEFWIREDHTIAENIDDFKAYLKSKYDNGNPVEIYYQLETPVELDFTDRQKLIAKQIKSEAHTYKNITNISTESAEVNPIANVKYLKDTEKYIEDKITTALTEINANN